MSGTSSSHSANVADGSGAVGSVRPLAVEFDAVEGVVAHLVQEALERRGRDRVLIEENLGGRVDGAHRARVRRQRLRVAECGIFVANVPQRAREAALHDVPHLPHGARDRRVARHPRIPVAVVVDANQRPERRLRAQVQVLVEAHPQVRWRAFRVGEGRIERRPAHHAARVLPVPVGRLAARVARRRQMVLARPVGHRRVGSRRVAVHGVGRPRVDQRHAREVRTDRALRPAADGDRDDHGRLSSRARSRLASRSAQRQRSTFAANNLPAAGLRNSRSAAARGPSVARHCKVTNGNGWQQRVPTSVPLSFTVHACDAHGNTQTRGVDPFRVLLQPKRHGHHAVALAERGRPASRAALAISGAYELSVTLGAAHIAGSPLKFFAGGDGEGQQWPGGPKPASVRAPTVTKPRSPAVASTRAGRRRAGADGRARALLQWTGPRGSPGKGAPPGTPGGRPASARVARRHGAAREDVTARVGGGHAAVEDLTNVSV